jgi:hypothetical protein
MGKSVANGEAHFNNYCQHSLHTKLPLQKIQNISCKCLILLRSDRRKREKSGFAVELGCPPPAAIGKKAPPCPNRVELDGMAVSIELVRILLKGQQKSDRCGTGIGRHIGTRREKTESAPNGIVRLIQADLPSNPMNCWKSKQFSPKLFLSVRIPTAEHFI